MPMPCPTTSHRPIPSRLPLSAIIFGAMCVMSVGAAPKDRASQHFRVHVPASVTVSQRSPEAVPETAPSAAIANADAAHHLYVATEVGVTLRVDVFCDAACTRRMTVPCVSLEIDPVAAHSGGWSVIRYRNSTPSQSAACQVEATSTGPCRTEMALAVRVPDAFDPSLPMVVTATFATND